MSDQQMNADEARSLRMEHARENYAEVINKVIAEVREKASSGAGRVEVWLEDEDAEAAHYAAEYLRARGFTTRVIDMDEGDWFVHVEWGATPQWP